MQNNKKSLYTVIGIVVLIVIIIIIKAVSSGDESKAITPMTVATSTATSTDMSESVSSTKYSSKNTQTPKAPASALMDAEINSAIRSSYVRVPTAGVDVKLVDGSATYTEGATRGKIQVGPIYAKVPTTNGHDVFVSMTLTDVEKESVLNYVALFHLEGKNVRYTSSVLVGDRLSVINVVASPNPTSPLNRILPYMDSQYGYRLTINYLGRKNFEPITVAPTLSKDMLVNVKNHIVTQ